ncbi:MAG: hypothetical protein CMD83_06405 [Gammaproteobacteria bacterium]|nr:hypothetical protein [Gammaproteobacteria bacterium]
MPARSIARVALVAVDVERALPVADQGLTTEALSHAGLPYPRRDRLRRTSTWPVDMRAMQRPCSVS